MTEQNPDGFRGDNLLRRANSLLETLIAMRQSPRNLQLSANFIYLQAKNIALLGEDVELLITRGRAAGVGIIVRAMLEGLFNLQAAAEDDTFAARKTVSEIDEWVRRSELMPFELNPDAQQVLDLARRFGEGMVKKYEVKRSGAKLGVLQCAKTAKAEGIYRNQYFVLSLQSHGEIMGAAGRELGHIRRFTENAAIFCVLTAAGQLLTRFSRSNEEQIMEPCFELANMLDELGAEIVCGSLGIRKTSITG
jgi:hypothetical protein